MLHGLGSAAMAKKDTPKKGPRDARKASTAKSTTGVGSIGLLIAGALCLFAVIAGVLFATGKGASRNPEATYVARD